MSKLQHIKVFMLFVFTPVLLVIFLINPVFFDRIHVSAYNNFIDGCSYCYDTQHGVRYCPEKAVDNGAFGRWIIPDVGVNVACFTASEKAQEVTDDKDSAALIQRVDSILLADHNYQGFNVIKKCKVGTVAYMYNGSEKQKYKCVQVLEGYNAGSHLTDLEGNVLKFDNPKCIVNYTCHFFSDKITIVQFSPVTE